MDKVTDLSSETAPRLVWSRYYSKPSVVRYCESGRIETGYDALRAQKVDPINTISSAKRLIGRKLEDIPAAQLPYRFGNSERIIELQTRQGAKTPIEVSADILRALKERAEASLGGELNDAAGFSQVIPVYGKDKTVRL